MKNVQNVRFDVSHKERSMKESITVSYNDIYKAYDNVQQNIMRDVINKFDIAQKKDWNDLLSDYNNLNMQVGNTTIKRTVGIPQGAKLAPIMFNMYVEDAMQGIDYSADFIYADNMILFESNVKSMTQKITKIKNKLQSVNLTFKDEFNSFNYKSTDMIATKEQHDKINAIKINEKQENPIKDLPTERILGFYLKSDKGNLTIDIDKSINECNFAVPVGPPYKMLNYYKQRILPKIRFNLQHINYHIDQINKYYIKKMCINYYLPNEFYNQNFKVKKSNYWAKFLSLFVGRSKLHMKLFGQNQQHIDRWTLLCYLSEDYYLSGYQATKFVFYGDANIVKGNLTKTQIKHNVKLLDTIYFAIVRKFNYNKIYEIVSNALLNMEKSNTYTPNLDEIGNLYKI